MRCLRFIIFPLIASLIYSGATTDFGWAQTTADTEQATPDKTTTETVSAKETNDDEDVFKTAEAVETAVIHPYRSANISSEIYGIIEEILFEEGDPIREGDIVVKIRPDRAEAAFKKSSEKLVGIQMALALAEEELIVKESVLSFGATSRMDVLKIRQEVEIKKQQVKETLEDQKLTKMDLDACQVKTPFTGFVAVRYKQPFESCDRSEKLFAVVDTTRVYAVANVPEALLTVFRKGAAVSFIHTAGQRYEGTVERLGKLIDPKSRTTKIYVVIENPQGDLEVGTTGSIEISKRRDNAPTP